MKRQRVLTGAERERFDANESRIREIGELLTDAETTLYASGDWVTYFRTKRSLEGERTFLKYEQGRAKDWLRGL